MNNLVEQNAEDTRRLYGVPSISMEDFVFATEERRHALLRALYPARAPHPCVVQATAEEGVVTTSSLLAPAAAADGTAGALIAPGQSTAISTSAATTTSTTATTSAMEPIIARKRVRDAAAGNGDSIISVDPQELKARHALVLSDASEREKISAEYVPPSKWKIAKVLVGHQGWVWTAAVDPTNSWFATGGFDAVIKVWDLSSGQLKLNLTGHKEAVRSLALSATSPYMFSGSDDHSVKCWDLERNEVVREFFGHKSAVHTIALHPGLDVVVSGGRDATVRVWDVRSRAVVHTLVGHTDSVMSVVTQETDPQVISGGSDGFVFLWDLAAGKARRRLTQHKKPVRGLALNAAKDMLISCGADDIRLWDLPSGDYRGVASTQVGKKGARPEETDEIAYRWSCCAMSPRNVLAVGCQDRHLAVYDWKQPQPSTGRLQLDQKAPCFYAPYQLTKTKNIPGTIEGEGGVNAVVFDYSGTRMITTESDKSVKIWQTRE